MIKFLIEHGAKIDQKNKYGFVAYDYATHSDHTEVLPLLGGRGEFEEYLAYSGSNDTSAKLARTSLMIVLIFSKFFSVRSSMNSLIFTQV